MQIFKIILEYKLIHNLKKSILEINGDVLLSLLLMSPSDFQVPIGTYIT